MKKILILFTFFLSSILIYADDDLDYNTSYSPYKISYYNGVTYYFYNSYCKAVDSSGSGSLFYYYTLRSEDDFVTNGSSLIPYFDEIYSLGYFTPTEEELENYEFDRYIVNPYDTDSDVDGVLNIYEFYLGGDMFSTTYEDYQNWLISQSDLQINLNLNLDFTDICLEILEYIFYIILYVFSFLFLIITFRQILKFFKYGTSRHS